MSYQVYRNTTLGTTLQDSLDELLANQQISRSLKDKVLEEVCHFVSFYGLCQLCVTWYPLIWYPQSFAQGVDFNAIFL